MFQIDTEERMTGRTTIIVCLSVKKYQMKIHHIHNHKRRLLKMLSLYQKGATVVIEGIDDRLG
jgi:hypothetical protein